MIELQKGIPLIDQHDENGYWGGGSLVEIRLQKV